MKFSVLVDHRERPIVLAAVGRIQQVAQVSFIQPMFRETETGPSLVDRVFER